ncbi:hypothetical protein LT493_41625 [Streptomyces tricolor]|nr:hypothetical protein [Streptomyces tricolor]
MNRAGHLEHARHGWTGGPGCCRPTLEAARRRSSSPTTSRRRRRHRRSRQRHRARRTRGGPSRCTSGSRRTSAGRAGGWPTRLRRHPGDHEPRFPRLFRQYYDLRARSAVPTPACAGSPPCPTIRCCTPTDAWRSPPVSRRTPPWSALGFAAPQPVLHRADLRRMDLVAALPLLDVRVPEIYDRL